MLLVLAVAPVVEWALGRFAPTSCASLIALIATLLRSVLAVTRLGSIPIIGTGLVWLLEGISGQDLDGDGFVGDPKAKTGPTGVVVLLLALSVPAASCAHFRPVVDDFTDCAGPEVSKLCDELKPRLLDVLTCSALETDLAPACAAAELADIYRDHGHVVVNCALIAIRDAFSAEQNAKPAEVERARLIKARAAEFLKREEARGVKLPRAGS
jgi:hypothetical protein